MQGTMTRNAFIAYAQQVLSSEALEPLYETIDQHNSEVAAFGDSWPGALIQIRAQINEVNSIQRQYCRLTGGTPKDFRFAVRSPA
jgi:hypothetical protein